MLENEVRKEALLKKWRAHPHGGSWCAALSERRVLRVIGMRPSAYRYQPVTDSNCAPREKIIALAQRHRRHGAGVIY